MASIPHPVQSINQIASIAEAPSPSSYSLPYFEEKELANSIDHPYEHAAMAAASEDNQAMGNAKALAYQIVMRSLLEIICKKIKETEQVRANSSPIPIIEIRINLYTYCDVDGFYFSVPTKRILGFKVFQNWLRRAFVSTVGYRHSMYLLRIIGYHHAIPYVNIFDHYITHRSLTCSPVANFNIPSPYSLSTFSIIDLLALNHTKLLLLLDSLPQKRHYASPVWHGDFDHIRTLSETALSVICSNEVDIYFAPRFISDVYSILGLFDSLCNRMKHDEKKAQLAQAKAELANLTKYMRKKRNEYNAYNSVFYNHVGFPQSFGRYMRRYGDSDTLYEYEELKREIAELESELCDY
jgi:hypothetical protein